jgi:signal transduction histidine kinase
MRRHYGGHDVAGIGGLTPGHSGTSLIATLAARADNQPMFDRLSDGIAGLIALAALAFASIGIAREGFYTYSLLMLLLAVSMLVVGAWWLRGTAPGTPFHEMALPAAVATVTPLLVGAGVVPRDVPLDPAPWLLGASAAATLGLRLADTAEGASRTLLAVVAGGTAVAAVPIGILGPSIAFESRPALSVVGMLLIAATTVVPGVVCAVLRHTSADGRMVDRERVVAALEIAVLGLTPGIAVITVWGSGGSPAVAVPLVIWILVVLAAQYFAVLPLERRATAATAQRDAVVAAMEAERSRIASDIHDDALQELTLLGWRLDAAGDAEGAATTREVAARLRAILGDLRLPVLDDLGTGAALEWLVERVGRLARQEIKLERADAVRPPADVELAFFRVAQEALANAVQHGRPPVVVRYWTSASAATLTIDDGGPGISERPATPGDVKHFGLANMAQRAEQVGALLNVRSWPSGGTRVTLEWRA